MTKVKVKISLDLFLSKAKCTNFFGAYKNFFFLSNFRPFFRTFFTHMCFMGIVKMDDILFFIGLFLSRKNLGDNIYKSWRLFNE